MSWIYQNKEFTPEDIPEGAYGFVYLMTVELEGVRYGYIGKKAFFSARKKPIGIREKKANPESKKRKKVVTNLNYKNYYSSNATLKKAHKEGIQIKRIILEICYSNRQLGYCEVKYQFKCDVLESDAYLNDSILGKFYKNGTNSIRD